MEHPISIRYVMRFYRMAGEADGVRHAWPGEELTMPVGSIWFHPYDGRNPVLVSNVKPLQEG